MVVRAGARGRAEALRMHAMVRGAGRTGTGMFFRAWVKELTSRADAAGRS